MNVTKCILSDLPGRADDTIIFTPEVSMVCGFRGVEAVVFIICLQHVAFMHAFIKWISSIMLIQTHIT